MERAPIVLIGFMGSGKSSAGESLARRLAVTFTDTDRAIEAADGRRVATIFAEDGETAFRDLERAVIATILGRPEPPGVLALGGGAAMDPDTRALLESRTLVVHLRVSLPVALRRVGHDQGRPMLRRPDLPSIHEARMAVYDHLADLIVDVDQLDVASTAARLRAWVRELDERGADADLR